MRHRRRKCLPTGVLVRLGVIFLGCTALAFIAPVAAQDSPDSWKPTTDLNEQTPDWLDLAVAFRTRVEGRTGISFREGAEDGYGLSRLRLDIGLQPASWAGFFVQLQDSRSPGRNNSTAFLRDPFDLRQGYVELGEREQGAVQLKVGRQILIYGAQRLIGPLDWGNTARVFDAAKVTIGKKGMSVDVFAASVVVNDPNGFNRRRDGENVHGIYGQLNRLFPRTTFEPYLLWKTSTGVSGEVGTPSDADTFTTGFRVVRALPAHFDVSGEYARQFGSFGSDDVSAWAGYAILGYNWNGPMLKPRISVEYSYASGDNDPTDGKHGTFEQLYGTNHLFYGLADLVGWKNIKNLRTGVALQPARKLKLKVDFHSFWIASQSDHLYNAGGGISVRSPAGGSLGDFVGRELDTTFVYKLKPNIMFGGGYGYFLPGTFVKQSTPGASTSFPYVFLDCAL